MKWKAFLTVLVAFVVALSLNAIADTATKAAATEILKTEYKSALGEKKFELFLSQSDKERIKTIMEAPELTEANRTASEKVKYWTIGIRGLEVGLLALIAFVTSSIVLRLARNKSNL